MIDPNKMPSLTLKLGSEFNRYPNGVLPSALKVEVKGSRLMNYYNYIDRICCPASEGINVLIELFVILRPK